MKETGRILILPARAAVGILIYVWTLFIATETSEAGISDTEPSQEAVSR